MNVLDILMNSILENPDDTFVEVFDSGDYRCIIPEVVFITVNGSKLPFKGVLFTFNSGLETLETFWNETYYCNSKSFLDFIKSVETVITSKNFCPGRFKSLNQEQEVLREIEEYKYKS